MPTEKRYIIREVVTDASGNFVSAREDTVETITFTGSTMGSYQAVSGSLILDTTSPTVTYVNASGSNPTITLPLASGSPGQVLETKHVGTDTNTFSLAASGNNTIDGLSSITVNQYGAEKVRSDGNTTWFRF